MQIKNHLKNIIGTLAIGLYYAPYSFAQVFDGGNTKQGLEDVEKALSGSGITENDSLVQLVLKFVNFSLPYLALGAFVGFIYASFLYVTAFGNDDQVGKAKKTMLYVVIGLVIVILSYSIVQLFAEDLPQAIN